MCISSKLKNIRNQVEDSLGNETSESEILLEREEKDFVECYENITNDDYDYDGGVMSMMMVHSTLSYS